jgi:hypothetical protein
MCLKGMQLETCLKEMFVSCTSQDVTERIASFATPWQMCFKGMKLRRITQELRLKM